MTTVLSIILIVWGVFLLAAIITTNPESDARERYLGNGRRAAEDRRAFEAAHAAEIKATGAAWAARAAVERAAIRLHREQHGEPLGPLCAAAAVAHEAAEAAEAASKTIPQIHDRDLAERLAEAAVHCRRAAEAVAPPREGA